MTRITELELQRFQQWHPTAVLFLALLHPPLSCWLQWPLRNQLVTNVLLNLKLLIVLCSSFLPHPPCHLLY